MVVKVWAVGPGDLLLTSVLGVFMLWRETRLGHSFGEWALT